MHQINKFHIKFLVCAILFYFSIVKQVRAQVVEEVTYSNQEQYQDQGQVTYQVFYDQLSPYGDWVNDPDFGFAWVPNVGPDFQPYRTNGHWVYTDYGWTWVSNYRWGWGPFHYGRWKFSETFGWIWIPGYTWGPAWVEWRSNNGYYGWAPLAPPAPRYYGGGSNVHVSIGFNFSWGNVPPANQWCFVSAQYVASPYVANYYVPAVQSTTIYNNTTIIKNTFVNGNIVNNNGTVNNTNNTTINGNVTNNHSVNNGTINNNSSTTTINGNVTNNRTVNNGTINTNSNNQLNSGNSTSIANSNKTVYIAGPPRADVEKATGQPISTVPIINSSKPGASGLSGNSISMYRPPVQIHFPKEMLKNLVSFQHLNTQSH